jgi:ribosomal-protein-alanine N-acetyltransferase
MMDYSRLVFRVEPMSPRDIGAVMEIELEAFSSPWSARAYDYELHYNENAHYYVVRRQDGEEHAASQEVERQPSWLERLLGLGKPKVVAEARSPIVGYGGFWLMVDEAHVSTIATHREWRGRGIGELLLVAMIDHATEIGARIVTLEVRVSNTVAQALYRKYGLSVVGERKRYYSDNGEDALVMSTPPITSAEFRRNFQKLQADLSARLSR